MREPLALMRVYVEVAIVDHREGGVLLHLLLHQLAQLFCSEAVRRAFYEEALHTLIGSREAEQLLVRERLKSAYPRAIHPGILVGFHPMDSTTKKI
jgi:hypothetical protein